MHFYMSWFLIVSSFKCHSMFIKDGYSSPCEPYSLYWNVSWPQEFLCTDSTVHAFIVGNWHDPCGSSIMQWRCQLTLTGVLRTNTSLTLWMLWLGDISKGCIDHTIDVDNVSKIKRYDTVWIPGLGLTRGNMQCLSKPSHAYAVYPLKRMVEFWRIS